MPKAPNLSNPIAAIRHEMGMKLEEFAEYVGHGAAMLKQIEAGRKPMSDELRDKIHDKTGVPYDLLLKNRWVKQDRDAVRGMSTAAFGGPSPSEDMGLEPLELLPDIMAIYFAMLAVGVSPKMALLPIRREIAKTLWRWGGEQPAEMLEVFKKAQREIYLNLFAVSGDQQGIQKPFFKSILTQLADTSTFKDATAIYRVWDKEVEAVISPVKSRWADTKDTKLMVDIDKFEKFVQGKIAKARRRTPRST
jgi:transcriptional regulator with XRE-family HTH domain